MGRAGSVASNGSARSSKSGTYRTVARDSYVDEGLFGSSKGASSPKDSPQKEGTLSPYKSSLIKTVRHPEVVTLTESDVQRMKSGAHVMTAEERNTLRHAIEERKEHERAAAKARKEKMLRLQAEAKQQDVLNESELLQVAADNATMGRAQALLQEEKDEVKHMNRIMRYAKCAAVREKQVEEKQQLLLAEQEEQQRLDLLMEIERLKALEAYQARDVERRREQERGAEILKQQLVERQAQRIREEELRDQERQAMAQEIERLQHEEQLSTLEKKQRAAALMAEVAAANAQQIERKKQLAEQEKEEEACIAEYIRQKDAGEQALAAEKAAAAHEREMEVARLRALQEKVQDTRSAEDELRAKRYQEAKDREWRNKEQAAAQRQAAMMADLAAARETQMRRKLMAQATMAEVEQAEFRRVLEVNREKQMQDMSQTMAQQQLSEAYKRDLLGQIQAHREATRAERQAYLEEDKKIRQQQMREKATLEMIKAQKLQELVSSGVPEKYTAELARMKIKSAK